MNQSTLIIKLLDITKEPYLFGNEDGRDVYLKLQQIVDNNPRVSVFGISLEGIKATDASFPRESVVSIAKSYRGEKGFFIKDVATRDLLDNWSYAARAKEQPLFVYGDHADILGVNLTDSNRQLLDFIQANDYITTGMVANKFDLSTQNASGKLKKLYTQGFILGKKEVAESGGHEFLYRAIK